MKNLHTQLPQLDTHTLGQHPNPVQFLAALETELAGAIQTSH